MTYEVIRILKKEVLGEFKGMPLEEVKDIVIKTFREDKNIVIYQREDKNEQS